MPCPNTLGYARSPMIRGPSSSEYPTPMLPESRGSSRSSTTTSFTGSGVSGEMSRTEAVRNSPSRRSSRWLSNSASGSSGAPGAILRFARTSASSVRCSPRTTTWPTRTAGPESTTSTGSAEVRSAEKPG
jgi:hypothetical protein